MLLKEIIDRFKKVGGPLLGQYRDSLVEREMAPATVEKYLRDVNRFLESVDAVGIPRRITKQDVICYKASLIKSYAPASVNSMLAALNSYLDFAGLADMKVKQLRVPRETYRSEDRELTREEYGRLVDAAKGMGRERIALVMETLCATGLRVSELRCVTVEAVREGKLVVSNKGRVRCAWLPKALRRDLLVWASRQGCATGPIFRTKSGRVLDRVSVWREMKAVALATGVDARKVYPHNLRHLFACVHYAKHRDLAALCDLLGHARIETTRIYVATSGRDQREQVLDLGLVA